MISISKWICFLLMLCLDLEQLEAFSYHETINITRKSSDETYDYVIGPEFFENEKFAYVKVKNLHSTPAAIEVSLEVYNKSLATASKSRKKFVADIGSIAINVTSMKLGRSAILSIAEIRNNNESAAMLIEWDQFGYPDPKLYLPMDHIIVSNDWDFQIFVNDDSFCSTFNNGKCWIQLEDRQSPKRGEFFHENLVWPSIHIDYAKYGRRKLFIRGFDAAGNYKFLECDGARYNRSGGCCQLLFLPNPSSTIEAHSLDRGLCYIKKPGEDHSVDCLKFDRQQIIFDRTASYEEPMSLIDVKDYTDEAEIVLITNKAHFSGTNCFNIILSKIPYDSYYGITHRHLVLECSDNEKLFKVSSKKYQYMNAITIEYICENDVEFIFKSITINDD